MKKRLISMLLLLVMLVSAVPMLAFSVAAEEAAEEEVVYDYNSLYADLDKMMYFIDFFKLNDFWGEEAPEMPLAPPDDAAYLYNGTSYDFTVVENRLQDHTKWMVVRLNPADKSTFTYYTGVSDGNHTGGWPKPGKGGADKDPVYYATEAEALVVAQQQAGSSTVVNGKYQAADGTLYYAVKKTNAPHPAYNAALNAYAAALKDLIAKFAVVKGNGVAYNLPKISKASYLTASGEEVRASFTFANGYMALDSAHAQSYISLQKIPETGVLFVESVYSAGTTPSGGNGAFFIAHDINVNAARTADGLTFSKVPTYNGVAETTFAPVSVPLDKTFTIAVFSDRLAPTTETFVVKRAKADGSGAQRFNVNETAGEAFGNFNTGKIAKVFEAEADALALACAKAGLAEGTAAADVTVAGTKYKGYSAADGYIYYVDASYVVINTTGLTLNGQTLLEKTPIADYTTSYADTKNTNVANIIGYNMNSLNPYLYSYRIYSSEISAEKQIQNAFADLAKWYKLDMRLFDSLSAVNRTKAIAYIVDYAATNGITLENDAAKRDDLQEKLDTFALDLNYNTLTEQDPSAEAVAFREVVRNVLADITGVLAIPVESRAPIYQAFAALNETQKNMLSMVQSAIDGAIANILANYDGLLPESTMTYKDLYVRKENLVVWADFFASKATDGLLYADYSYEGDVKTVWNQANSGTAKPEGTIVNNWDLPHKKWDPSAKKWTNNWNPDKIRYQHESGLEDALSKYVYKGATTFMQFADIPDHSWGHSNIREWGDGCLIGGKNNSWKIFSPGKDESEITYQYVMGFQGQASLQLDGFRMVPMINGNAFSIDSYTYYGYGVLTNGHELSNNSLMTAKPAGTNLTVNSMVDLTVTLEKFLGEDPGHYYQEVYQTNADGAIRYTDPVLSNQVSDPKGNTTGEHNLWRYTGTDGVGYLVKIIGNEYIAYNNISVVGRVTALKDPDGNTAKTVVMNKDNAGALTPDWTTATYEDPANKVPHNGAAVTMTGPYCINPFPEVSAETAGAVGPIVYKGTYNMGVYGNGKELMYTTGLSYQASDIGWVGNGVSLTTYAIRTYNCVLTEAEIHQNHFADLVGFYGLDLDFYELLDETERAALHKDLASVELGMSKAAGKEAYEAAIDAYLYSFDAEVEGAEHFLEICHKFGLNTRVLKLLSPESQARIFAQFADVDSDGLHYAAILQSKLNAAVDEEIATHYAAAYGHSTIAFRGWQVRNYGDFGLRALFATDLSRIEDLEARGATVKTGVLLAKQGGDTKNLEDLYVSVVDGEVVAPEGVTLVKGYWAGDISNCTREGTTLFFTQAVDLDVVTDKNDPRLGLDEEELEDPDAVADAMDKFNKNIFRNEKYMYVGFTVVTDAEGHQSIFYADATLRGTAKAYSLYDLVNVAKNDYKVATRNVQAVSNVFKNSGNDYISATVGNMALEDYKVAVSSEAEAQAIFQTAVNKALGFELDVVRRSEIVGNGYIYIGSYDNLYSADCYGVSTYGGNVYIWSNSNADIADAVALFADYLNDCQAEGLDALFFADSEVVRRAAE